MDQATEDQATEAEPEEAQPEEFVVPAKSRGNLKVEINFPRMIEACLLAHKAFAARAGLRDVALKPSEVAPMVGLVTAFSRILKNGIRHCWDGRAYCRFRDGICAIESELTATKSPNQRALMLYDCRWRGRDVG